MNHTTNLHLPQWEASDRIHHDDFNDAFDKLDAAVPRIETGSYTGDGTFGPSNPCSLTFSFAPKVVIITEMSRFNFPGYTNLSKNNWFFYRGTESLSGMYTANSGNKSATMFLSWEGNSFSWYVNATANTQLNASGLTYCYIAIG